MKTVLNITALLIGFSLIVLLSGCSISEDSISTSASNYVRLSEYGVGYRVYGSLEGCQLSSEGEVTGSWSLETENCSASNGEAQ